MFPRVEKRVTAVWAEQVLYLWQGGYNAAG